MGTGSGAVGIVYNTRERVVSSDPNRAQALNSRQIADVLRFAFDAQNEQDASGGGVEVLGDGTEASLRGVVLSGLRVRPEVGTFNTFITPGAALLIDNPSPGDDDSVASYVVDPGVLLAGALVLTPGAGSTRIDVVECQRVTNVFESDNRDVFNVSTGLFTPSQVAKVQGGKLTYRIRLGTPGSGFPGLAAGWMPLMVASVPAAASSWDVVTCWDVRPLATDRVNGLANTTRRFEAQLRALLTSDITTIANHVTIFGEVDTTFRGYRAGGILAKSSASFGIDIVDAANQAAGFGGFGTTTGTLWYLYLVFPFGLPRWVRYADAPSVRQPATQRGIPAVSATACNFTGTPATNAVSSPSGFGLQDPGSQNAICVAVGRGPAAGGTVPFGVMSDGTQQMMPNLDSNHLAASSGGSGASTGSISWTFLDGTHIPGNARAIWVSLHASFQLPDPASHGEGSAVCFGEVTVSNSSGNTSYTAPCGAGGGTQTFVDSDPASSGGTPGVLFVREMTVRIPLTPSFNPNPAARTYIVTWTTGLSSGITIAESHATMLGWELGP